jgi:hypothetical protein
MAVEDCFKWPFLNPKQTARELVTMKCEDVTAGGKSAPHPKGDLPPIRATVNARSDRPQYARRKSEKDAGTTILLLRSMPPEQISAGALEHSVGRPKRLSF